MLSKHLPPPPPYTDTHTPRAAPGSSLVPEVVGPECSLPVGVEGVEGGEGGGGRLQVAWAVCSREEEEEEEGVTTVKTRFTTRIH